MTRLNRRHFLTLSSTSLISLAAVRSLSANSFSSELLQDNAPRPKAQSCWLDLCAPFLIQDPVLGLTSEIVFTSDNFIGAAGYSDGADSTEYEIQLHDSSGRLFGEGRFSKQLIVPAMCTTIVPVSEIVGPDASFWGGMRIRLRPKTRVPTHASDLFSSAFVRWKTKDSFANVHANPDPLQWQKHESFFYSMPFPPLKDYECLYSLFNPYDDRSAGVVSLYDRLGSKLKELPYDLAPHSSVMINLGMGEFTAGLKETFKFAHTSSGRKIRLTGSESGGTIAVTNEKNTVKNFGYLFIKHARGPKFTIEHPIHQTAYNPLPAPKPFDSLGRLKAKNILYTPLVFNSKKIGGVTINSRFHLSSGAPVEDALWLSPFITDGTGNVVWQMGNGTPVPASIATSQVEQNVIKLGGQQSCILSASQLNLPTDFSGGLSLAITPLSNHTLMKVELRVAEWDAPAFTHFRPGLASARAYQKPQHRAGIATDYIVSGAGFETRRGRIARDEIVAVMNIDDQNVPGNPTLEVFGSSGLVARLSLGTIPGFSCRHYLLSDLLSGKITPSDLSLRLVDAKTTLLMSVVHLDYDRRDIAADHGSDRFSTFNEFTCDPAR